MNMGISILVVGGAILLMLYLLRRQKKSSRSEYGPAGVSEFRTDLPLDACMDRLRAPAQTDIFQYECRRETDGSFRLHLTLHRPTQQPLDTVYSLRLDAGRQTVVTLIFLHEAFAYQEPVFPPEMLDEFLRQKLDAVRTH
ncbi:MAG: hypothetical protein LKJ90_01145 [Faecalibacterium sp.]|jgi:hypothetical protein|nr:hypothetical protein [Faecalibacterium sp.]